MRQQCAVFPVARRELDHPGIIVHAAVDCVENFQPDPFDRRERVRHTRLKDTIARFPGARFPGARFPGARFPGIGVFDVIPIAANKRR